MLLILYWNEFQKKETPKLERPDNKFGQTI